MLLTRVTVHRWTAQYTLGDKQTGSTSYTNGKQPYLPLSWRQALKQASYQLGQSGRTATETDRKHIGWADQTKEGLNATKHINNATQR